MFTIGQILCHVAGDFLLQSHGMAVEKSKNVKIATYHAIFYSIPFILFLSPSLLAYLIIVSTHALIDRFRLPKYIIAFKNYAAFFNIGCMQPWVDPDESTGYPVSVDRNLALVLFIITDAFFHIIINGLALHYL